MPKSTVYYSVLFTHTKVQSSQQDSGLLLHGSWVQGQDQLGMLMSLQVELVLHLPSPSTLPTPQLKGPPGRQTLLPLTATAPPSGVRMPSARK